MTLNLSRTPTNENPTVGNESQQLETMPKQRYVPILLAGAISIAFGVALLITGSTASGVFVLALGAAAVVGATRQLAAPHTASPLAAKYRAVKAVSFFAGTALAGAVVFGLAVAGVTREPVVWALFGLAAFLSSTRVLVGAHRKRRSEQ
jgi:hypothetical protein